jgi:8-oxo-dGTP pyrophosphatase MutT (NUDIX family)
MSNTSNRKNLPYRETSDCFLLVRGKKTIVARSVKNLKLGNSFLSLPGGGIDKGEDVIKGAKRECLEEVGAKLKSLKLVITVCWDWFPEWADTSKRKERYNQFRGEKIHLLIGEVDKFIPPTSTEGDDWKGKKTMSIASAIKQIESSTKSDHENLYPYKIAQLTILKMLNLKN